MDGIFQQFFIVLNSICTGYISQNVAAVAAAIAPAAYTLLGIYVLILGFMYLRGMIQEPIMDSVMRLVKISVIFALALHLAMFNELIVDTFYNSPVELGNAFTGATGENSIVQSLDNILQNSFMVGKIYWDNAGVLVGNFGEYIIAILIWVLGVVVTAYAAFLMALAKIALSIILSLGPLFIITLLFDATKRFFESWISQLANYFFIIVLVVAANVFTLDIFSNMTTTVYNEGSDIQITRLLPFFIAGLLSILILGQVRDIAAALAGGISLSTFGLGRYSFAVIRLRSKQLASATKDYLKRGVKYTARKRIQYYKRNRNRVSKT